MTEIIRLALIFGGQSVEHAVSLESGKNIMDALDEKKYQCHLIGIDRKGVWRYIEDREVLRRTDVARPIDLEAAGPAVFLVPGRSGVEILDLDSKKARGVIDVVFPILHGTFGEDGTMQGYLKLLGVPFVGSDVLGSAVGMDKDVAKRLMRDAGLPVPNFITLFKHEATRQDFNRLKEALGLPFFLKPANAGSSVGVHKVTNQESFDRAMLDAFQYDTKVLVEEFVQGREIECSVIGNNEPMASTCGEVMPAHDFYSYEAKYLDANGARLQIPAALPEDVAKKFREMAVKTYQTLCLEGMSRVDFFYRNDGQIFVNEVNTIPGFTKISMYPKMWSYSGLKYGALIDRLIELAFERAREENALKR